MEHTRMMTDPLEYTDASTSDPYRDIPTRKVERSVETREDNPIGDGREDHPLPESIPTEEEGGIPFKKGVVPTEITPDPLFVPPVEIPEVPFKEEAEDEGEKEDAATPEEPENEEPENEEPGNDDDKTKTQNKKFLIGVLSALSAAAVCAGILFFWAPWKSSPVVAEARTVYGSVLDVSNRDLSRTFDADQTVDGKPETCWCVNTAERGGAGAELKLTLKKTALVSGIKLINGNTFYPEEDIFRSNGQVKDFTLTFSTGETKSFTAEYNADGSATYQTIVFDVPVETDSILLRVDSGYVGQSFPTNVCLGEIKLF